MITENNESTLKEIILEYDSHRDLWRVFDKRERQVTVYNPAIVHNSSLLYKYNSLPPTLGRNVDRRL